jgi:hypothetical protein
LLLLCFSDGSWGFPGQLQTAILLPLSPM